MSTETSSQTGDERRVAAPGEMRLEVVVLHDVGGVFHHAGTDGRLPGPDPDGRSYASFASFSDPDGNGWLLQEIRTRLPGR